jgi:K+-sensing histidine kinase KdpD
VPPAQVQAPRSAAASELIIDIATAAAGQRDLDQILHETLDRLRAVTPLTGGSIALVQGDELVVRAAIGPFAEEALGQRLRRGPSRSWPVIDTLKSSLVADFRSSAPRMQGPQASISVRSWLAVPIIRRGVGIGLLEIDSTEPNAFGLVDVELLETIARVLSGPVELADHHMTEQRANEMRDAFIGVISHELRTPVTTIYGLSKMLRQRSASVDPEVLTRSIEDVEAEADRLQRLVEDLLVLSRAERGAVDVESEPLSIARLLRRISDAESTRLHGRRIDVELAENLPPVAGEQTYVEQVVRNLLTNAAKYSQPLSPVRLIAEAAGDEVIVRVLDEGIGIEQSDSDKVFELFYRSPSATRMASGAGIGLFVCRALVQAMGGRIWAQRRETGGTEVGFALPVHSNDDVD